MNKWKCCRSATAQKWLTIGKGKRRKCHPPKPSQSVERIAIAVLVTSRLVQRIALAVLLTSRLLLKCVLWPVQNVWLLECMPLMFSRPMHLGIVWIGHPCAHGRRHSSSNQGTPSPRAMVSLAVASSHLRMESAEHYDLNS